MTASKLNKIDVKRYKKVPPEGGWGFLVLLGLAIFLTCTLGIFSSVALIFGEISTDHDQQVGAVLMGWYFASSSCVGLITNYFFKMFTVRAVALSGAMAFMLGSVGSIFATTLTELIFAFGVLEGAGFGLMISASYSTFNAYFVKKRIIMMSIAQSIFGLGTMAYPLFVRYFMDEYGYRGFMAILAAVNGHIIFAMLVMHPVEWHMKKILREDELLADDQVNTTDVFRLDTLDIQTDGKKQSIPLMSDDSQMNGPTDTTAKQSVSMKKLWKNVVDFLDLTLLKDPIYVNICLGIAFALYSDMSFFAIQPAYLRKLHFDKTTVTKIIGKYVSLQHTTFTILHFITILHLHVTAIGATADVISRIFLAISSSWMRLKARDIYLTGAASTIFARFAFLYVDEFLGVAIVTAVMGFLRTWIHLPLPLVFGDYLSTKRFPSGYGLYLFIQGMIMITFTSIVTKIGDVVKDDVIIFHCLTIAMAICVVPWMVELIWLKMKKN